VKIAVMSVTNVARIIAMALKLAVMRTTARSARAKSNKESIV